MATKTSKTREILCVVALCLVAYAVMHDMAIFIILNELYEAFPNSAYGVTLLISSPQLVVLGTSLLVPFLLKKISKKTVIVIAAFIYAITASFGALYENLVYMNVMNWICAISQGMISVAAAGLITDMYIDDEIKRGKIMGIYQGIQSAYGALMSFGAGMLAQSGGWTNVYKLYYAAIPIAILSIFMIPNNIKSTDAAMPAEQVSGSAVKEKIGSVFWMNWLSVFLSLLIYTFAINYISVYVATNGLGDEAFSGTLGSVGTIAGFICSMCLGFFMAKFGRGTFTVFNIFCVLGALVMAFAPSVATAYVGVILVGAGYSGQMAFGFCELPGLVPVSQTDRAISYIALLLAAAVFVASNLAATCLNTLGINRTILVGVVFSVLAQIIYFFASKMVKKQRGQNV